MHQNFPDESTFSSVVDWIQSSCALFGDAIAVQDGFGVLTYWELWNRSKLLAQVLIENGVRANDLVGLWAEQSNDLLVGIVGILAAGGAYVPLDPAYPLKRLEFIVSDAELTLIVAPAKLTDDAARLHVTVIATPEHSSKARSTPLLPVIEEDQAAYVRELGLAKAHPDQRECRRCTHSSNRKILNAEPNRRRRRTARRRC